MSPVEARFEEERSVQFACYRAECRHQFGRNCVGCLAALAILLFVGSFEPWSLAIAAFWMLMLFLEARATFSRSVSMDSAGFARWQSRQNWIAAANGDERSLKRLQNVQ